MVVALVILFGGLAAIATGSAVTRRRLRAEYGDVGEEALAAAEEVGLLPWWVTALVLGGWVLALAGMVLAGLSLLT